jgi:hypothetical protein
MHFWRLERKRLLPTLWILPMNWFLLLPLAAAGIVLLRLWRPHLLPVTGPVLAVIATVLLFYAETRYRLPAVPFLCIPAGAFLDRWRMRQVGRGSWIVLGAAAALSLGLAVADAGIGRWSLPHFYYNLGEASFEAGRYEEAMGAFAACASNMPGSWLPVAGAAKVLAAEGKGREAALWFRRAYTNLDPLTRRDFLLDPGSAPLLPSVADLTNRYPPVR